MMTDESKYDRRQFIGAAAMTIAAKQLDVLPSSGTTRTENTAIINSTTNTSFGPLKQIDAGLLNIGYAEAGPADGRPVILLHGWPYDMIVLPSNTSHFHWAKSGEYIAQVTAIGPLGFEYVNPKDDPRNENSEK